AGEVDGDPLSRDGGVDALAMDLYAPHPDRAPGGQQGEHVPGVDLPAPERPGEHRARAVDGEHAIRVQDRRARRGRHGCRATARASAPTTSVMPLPVRAEHMTTSAPGSSSRAAAAAAVGSAASLLVIATTPARTPSASSTAACSRVWGMTPSSAAMAMRYRS